jgi:predicted nucleotidyltransferase
MRMIPLIEQHREALNALCRRYRVARLDVFGSAAKGTFNPETSDLDFIVSFEDPGERGYAMRYLDFAVLLEALFGRRVDLLIDQPITNPYFRESVEASRTSVYESRSQEAAV